MGLSIAVATQNILESLEHIFKIPTLRRVKLKSGGYLSWLHCALLARNILAIRAERYLVNFQLQYSRCSLQGNPVAIAGHLLPVTHHLVDPHCSCDLDKARFGNPFFLCLHFVLGSQFEWAHQHSAFWSLSLCCIRWSGRTQSRSSASLSEG